MKTVVLLLHKRLDSQSQSVTDQYNLNTHTIVLLYPIVFALLFRGVPKPLNINIFFFLYIVVNLFWHIIMKSSIPLKPTGQKNKQTKKQEDLHTRRQYCLITQPVAWAYSTPLCICIDQCCCLLPGNISISFSVLWLKIHYYRQPRFDEMKDNLHDEIMLKSVKCTNRFIHILMIIMVI